MVKTNSTFIIRQVLASNGDNETPPPRKTVYLGGSGRLGTEATHGDNEVGVDQLLAPFQQNFLPKMCLLLFLISAQYYLFYNL